jgi:NDP-sugar pyrophosphorylase family protein
MRLPLALLAGGLATRLGAVTQRVPKILLEVAGRPFAEHQIDLMQRGGISRVIFLVGHLGEQVEAALGDGSRWGMQFEYVYDGDTLAGTGGALRRALPKLGPAFFVMYGDSYLECDFADVQTTFEASGKSGLMTVYRNDDRFDRSNVEFDGKQIVRYDKIHRDASMRHIDYGLGILTRAAFVPWQDAALPFDLASVYQGLIARGALAGYESATRFYEIGSHNGLEETRALLSNRTRTS